MIVRVLPFLIPAIHLVFPVLIVWYGSFGKIPSRLRKRPISMFTYFGPITVFDASLLGVHGIDFYIFHLLLVINIL